MLIKKLLSRQNIPQRSGEWYQARHNCVTASNIASVLEANPFLTKRELLIQKVKPFELMKENPATSWGIKYEPIAFELYQKFLGKKVYQIGLLIHDKYPWLGASPDGIGEDGRLFEAKCKYYRNVSDEIPLYWWMQIQLQMEVCDLEECDLFQCKFEEYPSKEEYLKDDNAIEKGEYFYQDQTYYWKLVNYIIHTVPRDRKWFKDSLPKFDRFWKDVSYYRKNGIEQLNKRKRDSESEGEESIRQTRKKINAQYLDEDWNDWINAVELNNFMNNDPLLDWLNIYGPRPKLDTSMEFSQFLNKKENEFKQAVMDNLFWRFPAQITRIAKKEEKFSIQKEEETRYQMLTGKPIIINPLLRNHHNRTYIIADLLIRTDYFNRIFKNTENPEVQKSRINWNYRIVSIKYQSFNGKNLNIQSEKNELLIANYALSHIIGYLPTDGYLLGRKYQLIKVNTDDSNIMGKSHRAIKWIQELKEDGKNWDPKEAHRWELYPNMSNQFDDPWHSYKKVLANHLNEITLIWGCGINERKIQHQNNIFEWDQIDLDLFNFNENKKETISNIIKANVGNEILIPEEAKLPSHVVEFFVDFETVNDFDDGFDNTRNYRLETAQQTQQYKGMIYMIGLGYECNGQWIFHSFTVDKLSYDQEKLIILQWLNVMDHISQLIHVTNPPITRSAGPKYVVYHWSQAEKIHLDKAIKRHHLVDPNIVWLDMLEFFRHHKIAISTAFNYGLKSIAKAFYHHDMIETKWEDSDMDGTSALLAAWKCHGQDMNLTDFNEIQDIVRYNEIDCKVIWDILKIFR